MEQKEQTIQWHPAFFAGIQIELGDEAKYFSFEAEHQLGTKPMAIDVLVKKEKERRIRKNIGRIFRTHNVIEYKISCRRVSKSCAVSFYKEVD